MPSYSNPVKLYRHIVEDPETRCVYVIDWAEYDPPTPATQDDPAYSEQIDFSNVWVEGDSMRKNILPRNSAKWTEEQSRINELVIASLTRAFQG
jgi:hypothetical protein